MFADAVGKTERSGIAPYQLAMALESDGRIQEARASYEEVWRRTGGEGESARRATNNLARLEARTGDLVEAERILRRGLERFPADPKMRDNLSKVLALQMAP